MQLVVSRADCNRASLGSSDNGIRTRGFNPLLLGDACSVTSSLLDHALPPAQYALRPTAAHVLLADLAMSLQPLWNDMHRRSIVSANWELGPSWAP